MTQNEGRSVCLLLSSQELRQLRQLLQERAGVESTQALLERLEAAETNRLLPLLSRALAHVGLSAYSPL